MAIVLNVVKLHSYTRYVRSYNDRVRDDLASIMFSCCVPIYGMLVFVNIRKVFVRLQQTNIVSWLANNRSQIISKRFNLIIFKNTTKMNMMDNIM